jgi:hypothetical protein
MFSHVFDQATMTRILKDEEISATYSIALGSVAYGSFRKFLSDQHATTICGKDVIDMDLFLRSRTTCSKPEFYDALLLPTQIYTVCLEH